MKRLRAILAVALATVSISLAAAEAGKDFNLDCEDGKILTGIIDKICWSCVLPMRIMGVGPKPAGAASSKPVCMCNDSNGVPEIGWQLGYFQPARIEEVVKTPWCSPSSAASNSKTARLKLVGRRPRITLITLRTCSWTRTTSLTRCFSSSICS